MRTQVNQLCSKDRAVQHRQNNAAKARQNSAEKGGQNRATKGRLNSATREPGCAGERVDRGRTGRVGRPSGANLLLQGANLLRGQLVVHNARLSPELIAEGLRLNEQPIGLLL